MLCGGDMTISTEDLLNSIMDSLERISYIRYEDIPNIDLYMDQVTTFMDEKLQSTTRNPGEDNTESMPITYEITHLHQILDILYS